MDTGDLVHFVQLALEQCQSIVSHIYPRPGQASAAVYRPGFVAQLPGTTYSGHAGPKY